ncbi:hypothetical protein ETAA8_24560 [Anatilimnocola aggregata]|uniref:Uncharacterized protein n=2 Tax=Anatilimnocola aggregata TaxID=2528021 RepID=A0A517YAZ2_9BACT|nr:hypothetical protein ETAA8_24560 [Anatilimnocola aggregata]
MWCPKCQQDVPAVVPGDRTSGQRCIRCQTPFAPGSVASYDMPPLPAGLEPLTTLPEQASIENLLLPPLPQEDWQLEAELRYVERLAMAWKDAPPVAESLARAGELSGGVAGTYETNSTGDSRPPHHSDSVASKPRFAALAWATLSVGVMCFVCGGVLLGWSAITGRQSLWSIGLPLTLFGQAGLILGLVLQLETLWQTNRATSHTLDQLDGELHELRHSTTLLTQSHSNPSQSFYLHLSEGASPHLLLADLKGQLDLLSQQMSKRR